MFVGFVIGFVCGFYVLAGTIIVLLWLEHRIEKHDVLVKHISDMFDISEETALDIVNKHS